jgi:hypothetical protein
LTSRNGPLSAESVRGSTPLSVGTTLAANPMIISEMKPTVIAWRIAPW